MKKAPPKRVRTKKRPRRIVARAKRSQRKQRPPSKLYDIGYSYGFEAGHRLAYEQQL